MPKSFFELYAHIIFSTKHRKKYILPEFESELYNYIGSICKDHKCSPIIVGGHKDHIHILCRVSKHNKLPDVISKIKSNSSRRIKENKLVPENFYWQNGYGAFSVSASHVDIVRKYILNQHEHHKKISFKDEYRKILIKNGINPEDPYIWD